MSKIKLSPSILAADFSRIGDEIRAVDAAGADMIHIDVMDGIFVPCISFGMPVIQSIRKVTNKPFDVHLMVDDPGRYIKDFKRVGADIITVHAEACVNLEQVIDQIKRVGCKAGVAINPATPVSVLQYVLDQVDLVLLMTVNPGFGGQKYIASSTEKTTKLRDMIRRRGLNTDIEVDGGIKTGNVQMVLSAGANIIVAGSAIYDGVIAQNMEMFRRKFVDYRENDIKLERI